MPPLMCATCGVQPRTSSMAYCRDCANIRQNIQYEIGPGRNSRFLFLYGITLEDYNQMFAKQNGTCAICHTPPEHRRLAVDHDHMTGEVRGLLCSRCNRLLGNSGDDPMILQSAIDYLQQEKEKTLAYVNLS